MPETGYIRKSAQEVEIDRVLAEEFAFDPDFATRFLATCGITGASFSVENVIVEPSLGGHGFGDLLVLGSRGNARMALLIEDKITAGAAARQAERYSAHADRMRGEGWDEVVTVLVAPRRYVDERARFDASVDLEDISDVMTHCDPGRLAFRRGVIARALKKLVATGVSLPDAAVLEFKRAHLTALAQIGAEAGLSLALPELRTAYYDGDNWVERIRDIRLSADAERRHRCWTSVRRTPGQVDLILRRAGPELGAALKDRRPEGATVAAFSGLKGWQVSLPVPEMRAGEPYREDHAQHVVTAMARLVTWFTSLSEAQPDA